MRLVQEIVDVKYFVVANEKEALLLESNLIKKYHPKYNVILNDDRNYPYIIVTNEKDPQYKYVRKFDKTALKSYGPLPIGTRAKEIMNSLQKLFPLRRCKGNIGKPCLYYQLNQCSGACFKQVEPKYYETQLKSISKFFQGNDSEIKKFLQKLMFNASDNLQFEEAQKIKTVLHSLELNKKTNDVDFSDKHNRDVVAYKVNDNYVSMVILFYRFGKLLSKNEFISKYFFQDISEIISV